MDLCALFPGPKHKEENMKVLLEPLVDEFIELHEKGVEVEDCYLAQFATPENQVHKYTHRAFLGPIYSDTPARHELMCAMSHAAKYGDPRSNWRATGAPGQKQCYYAGYAYPVWREDIQDPETGEMGVKVHADAKGMQYSHTQMLKRAEMAALREADPNKTGFKTVTPFVPSARLEQKGLSYFHYKHHFAIGWVHAAIWGVVKKFFRAVVGKKKTNNLDNVPGVTLSNATLKKWTERGERMTTTHDDARGYLDVVAHQGQWIMEDWVNWVFVYSEVVMGDDLETERPELAKAWWCLRYAIRFHLRPTSYLKEMHGARYQLEARKANALLWEYACILERETAAAGAGQKMLTVNVRLIVVYSMDMLEWLGSMSLGNEFWMERCIRVTEMLLGNCTLSVELVMANAHLLKTWLKAYMREKNLQEDVLMAWKGKKAKKVDCPTAGEPYFLDSASPRKFADGSLTLLRAAANDATLGARENNLVERFVRAKLSSGAVGEEVHSAGYCRVRTRNSTYVVLQNVEGYTHGQVLEYAKVVEGEIVSRWAIVDCYQRLMEEEEPETTLGANPDEEEHSNGAGEGHGQLGIPSVEELRESFKITKLDSATVKRQAVKLECIDTKCMFHYLAADADTGSEEACERGQLVVLNLWRKGEVRL